MKNYEQEKEPHFVDLFSPEMESRLRAEGKMYSRKIEPIRGAEHVTKPTIVETRLPDGTVESIEEAKAGDWIITGSKGERFVFTDKKFHDLYIADTLGGWIPRNRRVVALHNPFRKAVKIQAPWGTPEKLAYQEGSEKAIFVAEVAPDGTLTKDRYIIGDNEMLLNNYELIP
ncbi:MAG: hypothetical protein A3A28_01580 [Candidatus Sungbacteria bacterium RIFCSPLOWO2_01_FULL_47_32]|uniref:Uncharacterized protein n=1 Tax=Candidatus Sungbacteria bacterium RIFCSPHIGHO2_01_FULL_47_32 TaxID=1802264 RepID=A0A1G2K3R1_9BACT|nr:MAG: hypothetical protein UX72_C0030G0020 [Parcubacteria group bacterium GW2011_GWA2_47_10]OGZ93813.1 MAG: hypothetical protein A2633_05050 [Candidatus Sungbacteria bacterium RIFCSPHIGHO2_01_FULL_47_32]OGZ99667.1 MAG: hypothetical protein A3D57_04265 [Candidatus Sungbacteria bacterium RIFCSPHIGHO2_02_FULL_46_12]OHA05711.1 MAG: hypothetical protein A3A28_01580 [Candidatus Sungbacteria bacterium RIFCSPLOWO2_01_FULL_47_32]